MSKNTAIEKQLTALREAAARFDWRQCEVQMFGLYTQLSLYDGMRIAAEQLAGHLDTFERYHPDIQWIREWFAIIHRLEPVDVSEFDFPFHSETRMYNGEGIASPGSTAFMDGITLLQEAFDVYISDGSPAHCLNLLKGVVGSSIAARTFAHAADTCLKAWEDARVLLGDIRITDEYNIEELQERNQRRKAYDECTNDFQRDLWLAVADQLEQLLS